jgi:hypothetical protein
MTMQYGRRPFKATEIKDNPEKLDNLFGYIIIYDGGKLDHMVQALNWLDSKGWEVISSTWKPAPYELYVIAYRK